ncbi:MAG: 16S rRNA (guanine(966)-N(2))-methyltransferase RsmD [Xanthomonadaceae bacterium]|nr:16S rRNA (guanine(966)-N(2))-methyltransferase RsmD [Xanthomonadaceae bacterium]
MKTPHGRSKRAASASRADTRPAGEVRIVGGRWRGSKLPVADRDGLRPTADRVRETLFNWLQPVVPGARVLDLFAGSGALGLEALSRGAHAARLIERDGDLAAGLRATLERLRRGDPADLVCDAEVIHADALTWLAVPPASLAIDPAQRFDLAFLDPPFAGELWRPALSLLSPWLANDAWLYLEAPHDAEIEPGPAWRPHREGATRDVRFALYRRAC